MTDGLGLLQNGYLPNYDRAPSSMTTLMKAWHTRQPPRALNIVAADVAVDPSCSRAPMLQTKVSKVT